MIKVKSILLNRRRTTNWKVVLRFTPIFVDSLGLQWKEGRLLSKKGNQTNKETTAHSYIHIHWHYPPNTNVTHRSLGSWTDMFSHYTTNHTANPTSGKYSRNHLDQRQQPLQWLRTQHLLGKNNEHMHHHRHIEHKLTPQPGPVHEQWTHYECNPILLCQLDTTISSNTRSNHYTSPTTRTTWQHTERLAPVLQHSSLGLQHRRR